VSAPKKVIEEYFELKFIECGHRIRSAIPAHSGNAKSNSNSSANFDSGSGAAAAPARALSGCQRRPGSRNLPSVPGSQSRASAVARNRKMGKLKFEIGEPVGQSCSRRYRCLVSGRSGKSSWR
jgi:hypothetical protein